MTDGRLGAPRGDARVLGALVAGLFLLQPFRLGAWEAWPHAVAHLLTAVALLSAASASVLHPFLSVPSWGGWAFFWALSSAVSFFFSPFPGSAWRGVLTDVSGVALFFLAAGSLREIPSLRLWLLRALAGPPLLFSAVLVLSWFFTGCPGSFFTFLADVYERRLNVGFQNVNAIAGGFLLAIPLAASVLARERAALSRGEKWFWIAGLACAALNVLAWRSVMAFAALAAQGLFLLFRFRPPRAWSWKPILLALLAAGAAAAVGVQKKWTLLSQHQRLQWAAAGVRMAVERPLLGVGPGAFGEALPGFRRGPLTSENTLYSHSVWVDLLAERGMTGTFLFLGLVAAVARRCVVRREGDPWAAAAAGGFLFFNFVHIGFSVPALQAAFWGVLGLLAGPEERAFPSMAARRAWAGAAALFLAAQSLRIYAAEEHAFLGHAALEEGDAPLAARRLERSLRWNPRWSDSRALYASALASSGDAGGAAREVREAVALSPFAARHHHQRGWLLLEGGDPSAALSSAEKACLYNPLDSKNWFLKARVLSSLERRPEALAAYEKVLELDRTLYYRMTAHDAEQRRRVTEAARREADLLRGEALRGPR